MAKVQPRTTSDNNDNPQARTRVLAELLLKEIGTTGSLAEKMPRVSEIGTERAIWFRFLISDLFERHIHPDVFACAVRLFHGHEDNVIDFRTASLRRVA